MSKLKIHKIEMVDVGLLTEHPRNSNKQNRHTFKALKDNMEEEGFDENVLVSPRTDGEPGYWVVSGNHRVRAARALGAEELPCVVHKDWNAAKQQLQLVRRNYGRGKIDPDGFTSAVNQLAVEESLEMDAICEDMGFEDQDAFAQLYRPAERQKVERNMAASINAIPQVKVLDELGSVLSGIFEMHGDTVPHSYIIFPQGGKRHLYIQSTPSLKRLVDLVTTRCEEEGLDINIVLGGLLAIGMHNTDFKTDKPKIEAIQDSGSEDGEADL